MKITQVYEIVNNATGIATGKTDLLQEDLSNIVDVGEEIFNANALDKYVNALVNRIGQTIFVNRVYGGTAPSVLMDGWEYGSVLQKVSMGLPEAEVNETWELQDGQSYDVNIFHQPKGVIAKYFNDKITFSIPMSFTERQLKMSFNNATELNGFVSMIYTQVENSMTVKIDGLIRSTINNMIGETIYQASQEENGTPRAINLLKGYKAFSGDTTITTANALSNPDFIKYASYIIKLTFGRMRTMSTLFNEGGQPRHTPNDLAKIVLLEDFASAADVYLQSDTFHNELTKLPNSERTPYWQGSGTDFEFDKTSAIDVKSVTIENNVKTVHEVKQSGILGIIFDRWALGVNNIDRRVTSNYNASAEFYTNYYKYDAGYFNDFNENFVVFYITDEE